ncbi:MAG: Unknown protein [uncultured Sulfurovum sp.]|uniref:Uncharacterized protein n=1 Tax=uncultured Sulfurovum sp. TaxID=269237 RepID=A0A6S6TMX4_9BACT|nr:MAG: Unknown protein [uncultured Sulfurovum sp.]
MNYNVFIVSSPLQVMNAIEAVEHFKTQNNILLVLHTGDKKHLNQMKKMFNFSDWDDIEYILLPLKIVDKIVFAKTINDALAFMKKKKIEKLFVGEFRSDHVNHIVNSLETQAVYLLDDGLAQLNYNEEVSQESVQVKVRRAIYRLLFYKLKTIKYTFFTIFQIKNEKIIPNKYNFFRKQISNKKIENVTFFIGQPLVELGIMSQENYKNELIKIMNFYKEKEFIYISHRREKIANVQELSLALNFTYKVFDTLIELEMINATIVPSSFATFYSTAIVTLPRFIPKAEYTVFKSQEAMINKNFIVNISNTYKEFTRMGLKVEQL